MQDLIERLEKATGADRELDKDIYVLTTGGDPSEHRINWQYAQFLPRFTESMDAALTLVPEGWWWVLKLAPHRKGAFAELHSHKIGGGELAISDGTTPAIALCIAALKARSVATISTT